jgi:Caspase domain
MPPRALVIGIEQYPQATELAQTITGATATAEAFFDWITTLKHVPPGETYVCATGGTFNGANRFATAREAIVDAIAALVAAGQDQTDELFVYFSGHGLGFKASLERRAVDVLIASDFKDAASGGTKCLKLQEIQEKLYAVLGGAHHYYFIDACRTLVDDDAIDPIGLGRVLGHPAQRGRPTKYTLYSTAYGTPAAINSGFAPALLDGLHGKGHAKGFAPDGSLFVMFPLLCSYVQTRLRSQRMDQNKDGNGEGYILEIVPPPQYTCTITVLGGAAGDGFEATLYQAGNPALAQRVPFTGGSCTVPFMPGNLVLEVRAGTSLLTRIDPSPGTPLDFWDDCRATFRAAGPLPAAAPPPPAPTGPPPPPSPAPPAAAAPAPPPSSDATISLADVPNVSAQATNLLTGESRAIAPTESHAMPAGVYEVTMAEHGAPISRSVRTIAPGADERLGADPLDAVHASIVSAVGSDPSNGVVAFSETLGGIANRDLGLWLAIMGASHILADPTTFSKLRQLPLVDVTTRPPGSSGVYVLGATIDGEPTRVAVGGREAVSTLVGGLTGIFEALAPAPPGPQLVTISVGTTPRTFASFCLPNRLTFFVCSPGSRGQTRVNQIVLPMFHLQHLLPSPATDRFRQGPPPLRVVRTAYMLQAQFGRKGVIAPVSAEDRDLWTALVKGEWVDPVLSLLAGYEALRHGDDAMKLSVLQHVVPALDVQFPELPDPAAVAALLGQPRATPPAPPLFREGLFAFGDWEDRLPMPSDRLDFNHIWTAWRGLPQP